MLIRFVGVSQMLEKTLEFLHVAPLVVIALMLVCSKLYAVMFKNSKYTFELMLPSILLLCSIGIASGSNIHSHHGEEAMHLLDPCFGYSAILIGVAFAVARRSVAAFSKKA